MEEETSVENIYLNILGFAACAVVIILSGTKLSYYGDKLADLTNMGKAWVGLILMASITSLPELITGISSVTIVNAPDLAAGDIFGSCVFNLIILSILDTRIKQPLFSMVKSSHILTAIFGIILLTVAGMAIFLAQDAPIIFWISCFSFMLCGIYLLAILGIFKYEQTESIESKVEEVLNSKSKSAELRSVIKFYILHALIVVGAALFLPYFGETIAQHSGLGNSFFGTIFIALATSLPELVVSLAAIRMGSLDMAVGNLLGSNVFNMCILAVDDMFYLKGSLFKDISSSHLVSVFVTIIMTAVVGLGLLFKPKKKRLWLLGIDTFVLIILYVGLIAYLFVKK